MGGECHTLMAVQLRQMKDIVTSKSSINTENTSIFDAKPTEM